MMPPELSHSPDPDHGASKLPSDERNKTVITPGDTAADGGRQRSLQAWTGRHLGKYEITGVLGSGGMGIVLKGHDASIERDVAIKVLSPELSADRAALDRFLAEAKSAGRLNHPNVVTIYEAGRDGETHFLVMELVGGGSAEMSIEKSGAFSVQQATRLIIEACKGLAAAHAAGLVHRDVKPANLLLKEDGTVKVTDFGLAKRPQNQSLQTTRAGQVVGTPFYMSPEQCEGRNVDARSDIYSLGASYFALLTGKNPFEESGSVIQVMFAHCHADRPDPRQLQSGLPEACTRIVERAMAVNPQSRYQSVDEMSADLEALFAALSGAGFVLPSQSASHLAPIRSRASSRLRSWWAVTGILGALAVVIAVVAAIGISLRGDPAGDISATTKQENAQGVAAGVPPTRVPIKVGIIHSQTGTMAHGAAPLIDAALLAIDEINHEGGVMGRPVEALLADGRSDSETFAIEAKRLIQEEHVCTLFGCWTSASRKTVKPILEELDHLLVYPLPYEGIEESPNIFYLGATPDQQIIPAVKWAYAFENRRKFFVVGSDYVFPRVALEIIKDQLEELGAEFVGDAFLPLGESEFGPVVLQITNAKPDVILNLIAGDSNISFFSTLRAAGITPRESPTISFRVDEQQLQQLDPAGMRGDFAAWNYFQSIDSPENHQFVSAFRKKYGAQRVITDPMEASYVSVKLWAQAVREAASIEPPAIRRALRNQRMQAPEGKVRIDPATQHTFKTPRIGQVGADGQFEVVWTAARPAAPMPYPLSRTSEEWKALLHDLYAGWGNQWEATAK